MPAEPERFVVVTGGPGAGKSTLLDHLRRQGFACAPEGARAIIREQVGISGRALPWLDPELFAETMLCWDIRSYRQATEGEPRPVFFDRGVVDLVGYFQLLGRPVPPHMHAAAQAFRYHRRVFVAPPWPEIYEQDSERKQTFDEAERAYVSCVAVYREYEYDLVTLPRTTVEERARFVLDALGG
jgi:predicted ATPase